VTATRPTKPSLALLREMSDEVVLRTLMEGPRRTRAELAVLTGLSRPTTGEAIRRLESAGLVRDTGERTSGRGGVGTYYALAEDVGCALAVSIAPEGVVVEVLDAAGAVRRRVDGPVHRPAAPDAVTGVLDRSVRDALGGGRARWAAVSAADPVDKTTSELVHLRDAPFLLGAMSPATILAPHLDGAIVVDNDVNWAARAERAARAEADPASHVDDFVYLYLGEGLGGAVVADGQVRRGHRGLAGEIAQLLVPGPDERAMPLLQLFGRLGLCHPGSTAIDVDQLLTALAADARLTRTLAGAISAVLDAAVAFADPAFVVIGGTWGRAPELLTAIRAAVADSSRPVAVSSPLARDTPALAGARAAATAGLREGIVARSR
jgi:predicted NBD/HSP70 family sugar kinase